MIRGELLDVDLPENGDEADCTGTNERLFTREVFVDSGLVTSAATGVDRHGRRLQGTYSTGPRIWRQPGRSSSDGCTVFS